MARPPSLGSGLLLSWGMDRITPDWFQADSAIARPAVAAAVHGRCGDSRMTRRPVLCYRTPFRFIGRSGNTYYWQRPVPNDSRVEQITCNVDWFWGRR